jgi:hypothetical protein
MQMDISLALEEELLFSYDSSAHSFFDSVFSEHLRGMSKTKADVVLNLCRLSAAEFALLERSRRPMRVAPEPVDVRFSHAFFALAKTDSTIFSGSCIAARVLPTQNRDQLQHTFFVLFTGDGDKTRGYWDEYGTSLVEDKNYVEMLTDLADKYRQADLAAIPELAALDAAATGALHWQLLLLRAKLDICVGSSDEDIRSHLIHSKSLLPGMSEEASL